MTLIAMLLVVAQPAAGVGAKPDFSGQWVLNASEGNFGPSRRRNAAASNCRIASPR